MGRRPADLKAVTTLVANAALSYRGPLDVAINFKSWALAESMLYQI